MNEREIVIDIDSYVNIKEARNLDVSDDKIGSIFSFTICGKPMSGDELGKGENPGKNDKKEKRGSMSAKKPPKPPRPPRGLSLDAADQKLIKEISELAMIKRAKIERMKALKRMKSAKAPSGGNLIAMLFTILFCVVIILQGCPSGILPRNNSAIGIPSSPKSNGATEGKLVYVPNEQTLLTGNVHTSSGVGSPEVMGLLPGSENKDEGRKDIR